MSELADRIRAILADVNPQPPAEPPVVIYTDKVVVNVQQRGSESQAEVDDDPAE